MTTKEKEQVPANLPNGTTTAPEAPKTRLRGTSNELQIMARIDRILADLDEAAARRVVGYFAQREFGGKWTLTPPESK